MWVEDSAKRLVDHFGVVSSEASRATGLSPCEAWLAIGLALAVLYILWKVIAGQVSACLIPTVSVPEEEGKSIDQQISQWWLSAECISDHCNFIPCS